MIAHAMGAQVIGVDIKDAALNLAKAVGADHMINARETPNVIEAIHDLTGVAPMCACPGRRLNLP